LGQTARQIQDEENDDDPHREQRLGATEPAKVLLEELDEEPPNAGPITVPVPPIIAMAMTFAVTLASSSAGLSTVT